MSVFNIKSKVIANRDASPSVLTDPIVGRGTDIGVIGVEQLPTTADIASRVVLISVPSSARIAGLDHVLSAIGTSALDIAVWYPTTVPIQSSVVAGKLISSSTFVSNIAGVDTGVSYTDSMGTVATVSVVKRSQPLWQMVGLASDPLLDLDIGFSVRTTNSIAGYVGLRARYVR